MDREELFCERLEKLYVLCEGCALGESARVERGVTPPQRLFDDRQPFPPEVEMPVLGMELGAVRVEIRPRPIYERADGRMFGCVAVDRALADGRSGATSAMDGYSCWTDLNDCGDESWYLGAVPNTERPVDGATVKMWLRRSGPMPLF
jgi:hypothetical protein